MTLSTETVVNYYTGAGDQDTYSYTFKIFSATDLVVTVTDTDDTDTVLTNVTDYTVTGMGLTDGGEIVLTAGDLTTDYVLSIKRVRPLTQETDLKNNAGYYPVSHENALDHITMVLQQLDEAADRSLKISKFDEGFDAELPAGGADNPERSIIVNAAGDGLEWGPTGTVLAAAAANATTAANAAAACYQYYTISGNSASSAAASADSAAADAAACEVIYGAILSDVGTVRTANYECGTTGEIVRCDPSAGGFMVTLPAHASSSGVRFIIKNVTSSTNAIVVTEGLTPSAYGIDGLPSRSIASAYGSYELVGNGTGWMVIQ